MHKNDYTDLCDDLAQRVENHQIEETERRQETGFQAAQAANLLDHLSKSCTTLRAIEKTPGFWL